MGLSKVIEVNSAVKPRLFVLRLLILTTFGVKMVRQTLIMVSASTGVRQHAPKWIRILGVHRVAYFNFAVMQMTRVENSTKDKPLLYSIKICKNEQVRHSNEVPILSK